MALNGEFVGPGNTPGAPIIKFSLTNSPTIAVRFFVASEDSDNTARRAFALLHCTFVHIFQQNRTSKAINDYADDGIYSPCHRMFLSKSNRKWVLVFR